MKRLVWLAFLLAFLFLALLLVILPARAQVNVTLVPTPKVQWLDLNGDPLASGHVHAYISGTTTNQATYTDSTGGTPNANPVGLDSAGRAEIWLEDGLAYTLALHDSSNALVWSVDGVSAGDLETALVIGTTAVTFTSTPTFDSSTASYFSITLSGNVTSSTISNASDGRIIYFNICQDATGGRTFTWPASVLTAPTVGTAVSSCTSASFIYDGTNWRELAASSGGSAVFDTATIGVLNSINAVDGNKFTTIQAAIDDAGVNGAVFIPPGSYTPASIITLSNAGVTIFAEPGTVTVTKSANGEIFSVSAADVTIRGLILDANKASFTGSGIEVAGAGRFHAINNVITNAADKGIHVVTSNDVLIERNRITGSDNSAIFIQQNSDRYRVLNNFIDVSGAAGTSADAVQVHATTAAQTVDDGLIAHNELVSGAAGGTGFCVEVGAFGGDTPSGVIVSDNICRAGADSGGGLSFSTVSHGKISGNTIDSLTRVLDIGGIEVTNSDHISITENRIIGGSGVNFGIGTRMSDGVISNNIVDGFKDGGIGIEVSASVAFNATRNIIIGNRVILPAAPTLGTSGIRIRSNHASADLSFNVISSNSVSGDGDADGIGIALSQTIGTLDSTLVVGNLLENLGKGINRNTETNSEIYLNKFVNVTTAFTGSSGSGEILMNFATGTFTLAADGASISLTPSGGGKRTNVTSAKFLTGIAGDGSGFKHKRDTEGCATAATAGTFCDVTVTWTTVFADANYSVICVGQGITSAVPLNGGINTKIAASVKFRTVAGTAAAAEFDKVECIAAHD